MISLKQIKICAIPIITLALSTHTHAQKEKLKTSPVTHVKVFDDFIGKGYKTATDAAILNSKKGVLIVLLSSPHDGGKLDEDVKNIAQEVSNTGRNRIVIILADPLPDTIGHHVRLFANGKPQYIAFALSDNRGMGSGVEFSRALKTVYDACIRPLEPVVHD